MSMNNVATYFFKISLSFLTFHSFIHSFIYLLIYFIGLFFTERLFFRIFLFLYDTGIEILQASAL